MLCCAIPHILTCTRGSGRILTRSVASQRPSRRFGMNVKTPKQIKPIYSYVI